MTDSQSPLEYPTMEQMHAYLAEAHGWLCEANAELYALRIVLRNVRAASAKFKRQCDRCTNACNCTNKLNAEIHRMVGPLIGKPSILRGDDA